MKSSRRPPRRRVLASAVAIVATSSLAVFMAAHAAAAGDTRWGADYFPNVTLTTQAGASARFFDDLIKGKIVAIDLIYTTCEYSCPLETARLAQVQRLIGPRMGRDVFFYSITIDPQHDTPAVLDEYARKFGAGPGWLFLTGAKADIDLLTRKLGLYSPPDPNNADGHLPYLLVGNQTTGQWMRNSAVDNPKFLARTIGDWVTDWQGADRAALKSYADSAPLALDLGRYTFNYHCAACHTIGGGTRIGPDLAGVTARRDRDWLRRFIAAPGRMNADGDPIAVALRQTYGTARMPTLDLSDEDVAAVIAYLEGRSRAADDVAPTPAPAASSNTAGPLSAILEAYLRVQRALAADTIASIRGDARTIDIDAAALGADAASIRTAASRLGAAADLKTARAAFGALSEPLIALVRSSGAMPPDLVVAYCPMAQKSWLQNGTQIQNPYYGKAMPGCGRVD